MRFKIFHRWKDQAIFLVSNAFQSGVASMLSNKRDIFFVNSQSFCRALFPRAPWLAWGHHGSDDEDRSFPQCVLIVIISCICRAICYKTVLLAVWKVQHTQQQKVGQNMWGKDQLSLTNAYLQIIAQYICLISLPNWINIRKGVIKPTHSVNVFRQHSFYLQGWLLLLWKKTTSMNDQWQSNLDEQTTIDNIESKSELKPPLADANVGNDREEQAAVPPPPLPPSSQQSKHGRVQGDILLYHTNGFCLEVWRCLHICILAYRTRLHLRQVVLNISYKMLDFFDSSEKLSTSNFWMMELCPRC